MSRTSIAIHEVEPLFDRIGVMLTRYELDPSPLHYGICHRYLLGDDDAFVGRVDHVIARFGGLTAEAVATLDDDVGDQISADALQAIADAAQAHLARVTGIVDASGADVRAYNAALAGEAAAIDGDARNSEIFGELVALTRTMIEKSRDAGDHLRRTGTEIAGLRDKLVEARASANSDALTGLPNRRALDTRMAAACAEAAAAALPLSVAICDIDHFKRVNDVHGHPVGDEVIKMVADALRVRRDTFVSRYGGEEFVVLFENTDAAAAVAEMDRIRQEIAARDIKIVATGRRLGRISFSAGVAELGADGLPSTMLKRADIALYRAKDEGRDRVLTAQA